jgi:hypothetical protein
VSTILPIIGVCGIPIGLGVVLLVMRSVLRDERASMERRLEAWRAGGCVGPEPDVRDRRWDGWGGGGGGLGM